MDLLSAGIINNTPDPAMWRPIEEHCRTLGARFKFVREDKLDKFAVGKEFDATLPALKGRKFRFKVYRAAVLPDFATWRATRSDQGFDIKTGTKVTGVAVKGKKATVSVEPAKGGAGETIEADVVLVAIGRKPNTEGLGLDRIGLATNARGQIEPDHDFATTVPGVWAVGDVIPGPMLAHKAEDEGIAVAENIAGLTGIVNHDVIPGVVYTQPEIASVGLTEAQAKERGAIKVGKWRDTLVIVEAACGVAWAGLAALTLGASDTAATVFLLVALVAVLASGIGVSLAVITAKRLVVDSTTFALVASRLAVPWARLSLVVGAAVVAALVAALVPAVSAARISAADALRRDD